MPLQVPGVVQYVGLFTHWPLRHWASAVHWHVFAPVLQVPVAHEYAAPVVHVAAGSVKAWQLKLSGVPVPVQLTPLTHWPGPVFALAPLDTGTQCWLGHWLSVVHTQAVSPALHAPIAQVWVVVLLQDPGSGTFWQFSLSAVPLPVQVLPPHCICVGSLTQWWFAHCESDVHQHAVSAVLQTRPPVHVWVVVSVGAGGSVTRAQLKLSAVPVPVQAFAPLLHCPVSSLTPAVGTHRPRPPLHCVSVTHVHAELVPGEVQAPTVHA
jgi:hypothetical protein